MKEPLPNRESTVYSRRNLLRLTGLLAVGLLVSACDNGSGNSAVPTAAPGNTQGNPPSTGGDLKDFSAQFASYEAAEEPNADPSKVVWPDFVTSGGSDVRSLYEFQLVNGELMRYIPCFCGCFNEDGHRNNRDCYIESVSPDGTVVFDNMAPT